MAKMEYMPQGIKEIYFKDSLFVTTGLEEDENKEVKGYIECRGGIIRDSVTKNTDCLIYKDGGEETAEYRKAMDLIRDKGLEINVLPLSLFLETGAGEGTIEFGRYPFEADGTEKPIRWIVLRREEGRALLLSAYGLDAKPYNEKFEAVTWETCTLRRWLNREFFETAFTEDEKRRILLTKLQNEDDPRYQTPGGNDTEDRVFLLSVQEVEEYLPEELVRRKKATPNTVNLGALNGCNGNCWWWLRSSGDDPYTAAGVYGSGDIDDIGLYVYVSKSGVCPALWIKSERQGANA